MLQKWWQRSKIMFDRALAYLGRLYQWPTIIRNAAEHSDQLLFFNSSVGVVCWLGFEIPYCREISISLQELPQSPHFQISNRRFLRAPEIFFGRDFFVATAQYSSLELCTKMDSLEKLESSVCKNLSTTPPRPGSQISIFIS